MCTITFSHNRGLKQSKQLKYNQGLHWQRLSPAFKQSFSRCTTLNSKEQRRTSTMRGLPSFRRQGSITIFDGYTIWQLRGCAMFSNIQLRRTFHQSPTAPVDFPKTTSLLDLQFQNVWNSQQCPNFPTHACEDSTSFSKIDDTLIFSGRIWIGSGNFTPTFTRQSPSLELMKSTIRRIVSRKRIEPLAEYQR